MQVYTDEEIDAIYTRVHGAETTEINVTQNFKDNTQPFETEPMESSPEVVEKQEAPKLKHPLPQLNFQTLSKKPSNLTFANQSQFNSYALQGEVFKEEAEPTKKII